LHFRIEPLRERLQRSVVLRALLALLLTPPLAHSADPNTLTAVERAEGWRLLFDGKTTAGWEEITGKPFPTNCWTVKDSSLKALVRTDGFQDIRTVEEFTSFDLQFDWKLLPKGNSGVKYLIERVDEWTNAAGRQARARGYEYQLADDANPDAASDPRRVAASLYSLIAPSPRVPPRIAEFNHSRIVVRGAHIEHWLNGMKVVDFDAGARKVARSPISLQNHSSETWFRNIKIRMLTGEERNR
jgi:hypothetical protein